MISIIIPLYNEAENVKHYGEELFPIIDVIAKQTGDTFEFILVDDGSGDDTVDRLHRIAAIRPHIKVLEHGTNRGMGNAIKTGLKACMTELVITMDADLTFRPQDVELLIRKFRETGADLISGSPYLGKGLMEEVTPFRLILSKSVNFLYRLLLGEKITCVSPIFRLYRKSALDGITISSSNFEINAEIISKFIIAGKNVVEVPVPLLKRRYGVSKIRVSKEIRNNIVLLSKIFQIKYLHGEWN